MCAHMYVRCSGIRECCVCYIKATPKVALIWNEVLDQFLLSYIENDNFNSICYLLSRVAIMNNPTNWATWNNSNVFCPSSEGQDA